jgi:hypothetical protein
LRSPAAENQNPPPGFPAPRLFLGDIAKGGGAKERGREEKTERNETGGAEGGGTIYGAKGNKEKTGDVAVKYPFPFPKMYSIVLGFIYLCN